MVKKKQPKKLSPRAQEIMRDWETFSQKNGIPLATWNPLHIRAEQVAENGGACPCKPNDRPICPCSEVFKEVALEGCCFCAVFGDETRYKKMRGI
ncbi:MAG: hypothetical protein DDT32_00739 [Syntrophomonadaceae bacterium]|nr:hypothetical protein [Bacillota bacterium]